MSTGYKRGLWDQEIADERIMALIVSLEQQMVKGQREMLDHLYELHKLRDKKIADSLRVRCLSWNHRLEWDEWNEFTSRLSEMGY